MFFGFGTAFGYLFPLLFLCVFGVIIYGIVRNISTWHKNNQSPRLAVSARIVAKRADVSCHHHPNAGDASGAHGFSTVSNTSCYVTFQVESGDRLELAVNGAAYGMLTEGDVGTLRFQGTRYLGFDRS